jgi:hypothetical protein
MRPRATTANRSWRPVVVAIAGINAFNRLNAATRQLSGEWVASIVAETAHAV